jgi:hypothetical protein
MPGFIHHATPRDGEGQRTGRGSSHAAIFAPGDGDLGCRRGARVVQIRYLSVRTDFGCMGRNHSGATKHCVACWYPELGELYWQRRTVATLGRAERISCAQGIDPGRSAYESLRRSRLNLKRIMVLNRLSLLVTLTYREPGCKDLHRTTQHLSTFVREYWRQVGGRGPAVFTRELHPRGHGYHGMVGLADVELDAAVAAWPWGQIHCDLRYRDYLIQENGTKTATVKLAYYMSNDFATMPMHTRRFVATSVRRPVTVRLMVADGQDAVDQVTLRLGRRPDSFRTIKYGFMAQWT